jgi:hypothetical protein
LRAKVIIISSKGNIVFGDRLLEEKANLTEFRVILKREKPPTDINNVKGTLILQKDELFFRSIDIDENKNRKYTLKDFSKASIISFKEWFKKKKQS